MNNPVLSRERRMAVSQIFDMSLRDVLRVAASSEPTPGGGSVSAITGAFAVSMAAMVSNLTIGKKKYKDVEEKVTYIRDQALCLLTELEDLTEKDMAQFTRFMEIYRMSKATPEEKERRDHLMQEALMAATETPLEIARTLIKLLKMVEELAPIGNTMAISDAGVSVYLAEASLNAALLSVDINLPQIKDVEFVKRAKEEKSSLIEQAREIKERALAVIMSRIGSS